MGYMRYIDATQHVAGTSTASENPWGDQSEWGVLAEPIDNSVLATMLEGVKYMRDGVGSIRQATAQESAAYPAAIAAVHDERNRVRAKAHFRETKRGRVERAKLKFFAQQINALRALHSLPPLTLDDFLTFIDSEIDSN